MTGPDSLLMTGPVSIGPSGVDSPTGDKGPEGPSYSITGMIGPSATGDQGIIGDNNNLLYSNTVSINTTGFFINNIFSAKYDAYRFMFNNATGAYELTCRLSANGVGYSTTNVKYAYQAITNSNYGVVAGTTNIAFNIYNPGQLGGGIVDVYNPYQPVYTLCIVEALFNPGVGGMNWQNTCWLTPSNTSFDGIRLYTTGGTMNTSLQIYGYPLQTT